ncbi:MAG: hypothetical protein Q8L45_03290 [Xanthomonadaceae bacterium]|nr:hypothetical protein [Xanthomonadaceae bacterium]MDP2185151.1 hypothetical protein [Xanthomonadales bacterium]MDZ4117577.1 hypothetical protein [Xanthomonadaceae bacterium]
MERGTKRVVDETERLIDKVVDKLDGSGLGTSIEMEAVAAGD